MFFNALTVAGSQGSCLNIQTPSEGPSKTKCKFNETNICVHFDLAFQ